MRECSWPVGAARVAWLDCSLAVACRVLEHINALRYLLAPATWPHVQPPNSLLYYPLPIYSIYLSIGRECAIKNIYTEIFTTGFFCCSLSYGVNNFPLLRIPLLIPKKK